MRVNLEPYKRAYADRSGLSLSDVNRYYSDSLFRTGQVLDSQNPQEGIVQALDFYSTGRVYGGNYNGLYFDDFREAVVSIWQRLVPQIQFLDFGCGAGVSTVSGVSILEWIRKEFQKVGQNYDYQVRGVDTSDKLLKRALEGQYSLSELQHGLYLSRRAYEADTNLRSHLAGTALQNSAYLDQVFIPNTLNQTAGDEQYALQQDVRKRVSYTQITPFGLTEALNGEKFNLISGIHLWSLFSDEGIALNLSQISDSMEQKGLLFHDLFLGAVRTSANCPRQYSGTGEFFQENPETTRLIGKAFDFLPHPTKRFYVSLMQKKETVQLFDMKTGSSSKSTTSKKGKGFG
jgi:chemotaxis methyl-accepting protein methylase